MLPLLKMLVLMLLHGAADGNCPSLILQPATVVVRHGDSVEVNCSTLDSHLAQWETTEGNTSSKDGQFVTWSVSSLLNWDPQAQCNMKSNGSDSVQCSTNLTLIVYKPPDSVSISLLNHTGPMVEGTEYQLSCDVLNVAPVQNLIVIWYKGNETIMTNFSDDQIKTPVNRSSILTITPSRHDDGAQYRCEAQLDLGPDGPQLPAVSSESINVTTVAMTSTTPETSKKDPELNPPRVVVRYGDSVSVNCSTSSTDHDGMGWEATVGATGLVEGVSFVTWTVENVTDWNAEPKCFINPSDGTQHLVTLPFTLYKPPDGVSISLLNHAGPMVEETEYQLSCDVLNVAPVQNLIVIWYKGNETIMRNSSDDQIKTPVNRSSILTITPSRHDDGAQYRCEAQLDLGPDGPQAPPTVTSDPFVLDVRFKPVIHEWPSLFAAVEDRDSLSVIPFRYDGNPPPQFEWYLEERRVNATKLLTRRDSGEYVLTATNDLGNTTYTVNITVEYVPELSCPDRYDGEEGKMHNPTCTVEGSPTPTVIWRKDGMEVKLPEYLTRKDRGEYIISAVNTHGKTESKVDVNILYAPEFLLENSTVEVAVNSDVSLVCSADGNPHPELKWSYSNTAGNVHDVTTEGRQRTIKITGATSTNAGNYICTATNKLGWVTISTTVKMRGRSYAMLYVIIPVALILIGLIGLVLWRRSRQGSFEFRPIPMTSLPQNENGMD